MAKKHHTFNWSIGAKLAYYTDPQPNGCWLWRGTIDRRGYGQLRLGRLKLRKAHRLSWEDARGPIPPGMHVCHRCDTPACVNPDHLFLGTHADNMADMVAKGRAKGGGAAKGAANRMAKLTEEQALAVRADTRSQRVIAEAFGISQSNVYAIRAGIAWTHLTSDTSRDA